MNGPTDSREGAVSSPKSSGIKVIIVGAGFAGLTAAIECTRHGHSCLVLESYRSTNVQLGDVSVHGKDASVFDMQLCFHGRQIFLEDWSTYSCLRQGGL